MKPVDIVILLVILAIVGSAVAYIIIKRKSGAKCIGCPYAKKCPQAKKFSPEPSGKNHLMKTG